MTQNHHPRNRRLVLQRESRVENQHIISTTNPPQTISVTNAQSTLSANVSPPPTNNNHNLNSLSTLLSLVSPHLSHPHLSPPSPHNHTPNKTSLNSTLRHSVLLPPPSFLRRMPTPKPFSTDYSTSWSARTRIPQTIAMH